VGILFQYKSDFTGLATNISQFAILASYYSLKNEESSLFQRIQDNGSAEHLLRREIFMEHGLVQVP
jgi:hypothetical protein